MCGRIAFSHVLLGFLLFFAGTLAGLLLSTASRHAKTVDIWADSEFLIHQASVHPAYRLLLAEQQTQRYVEMRRLGSTPKDLAPLLQTLTRELVELVHLEDFPLPFRARRLLAEVLCDQNKFDEAQRLLLPLLDNAPPSAEYEKREYLTCIRMLGALSEVSGDAARAVSAYTAYVSEASGIMNTEEVKGRLQRIASLTASGSAFPAVSADSPEIQSVLQRLLLRSVPRSVERHVPAQGQGDAVPR